MTLTVTVWNEYKTQRADEAAVDVYPDGIHATLASFLSKAGYEVRTALFDDPEHGLTQDVLADTDVLVYWSHALNDQFDDTVVDRVQDRVLDGMGFVPLHSARRSKIFARLMGTDCSVRGYRDRNETERVWITDPGHPIVDGLENEYIEFEESQIVAEPFAVPEPDRTVMISWIEGGEVFRSGCCFTRGNGRIFFFGPGHETHPVYHRPAVQTVITNAVKWVAPTNGPTGPSLSPSESLPPRE